MNEFGLQPDCAAVSSTVDLPISRPLPGFPQGHGGTAVFNGHYRVAAA